MCNPIPLRNWLFGILAAIIAAAIIILGAAIANVNPDCTYFECIYLSPALLLAGAGLTGIAAWLCGQALDALNLLCTCTRERCAGQCNNMRNILMGIRVVLGIQATACLTVAAYAWIPYAAAAAILAIEGSLLMQIPLIISAIIFFRNLANCARSARPPLSG